MLAHEHAHLAARHHRWLTAAALVAQALPLVPLPRDAPALVGRLLEMDADELAATHHEPRVIASALVAVAASAVARATERPSGAPQITGGADALARVQRLLRPPAGLPAGTAGAREGRDRGPRDGAAAARGGPDGLRAGVTRQ